MRIPSRIVAIACCAFAAGAAVAGGPRTLVVREGLTAEQLDSDGAICLREAKAAERGRPIAPLPGRGGTAARAGAAMATGALKGLSDMERFNAAHDACLDRLGYRQVELTDEQRRAFNQVKGKAGRLAWIVEFSREAIASGK